LQHDHTQRLRRRKHVRLARSGKVESFVFGAHVATSRVMDLGRLIVLACFFGCAGHETAWTTLDPPDLQDGSEAFVLIGNNALHLANVEQVDGHLRGRVLRAWLLPACRRGRDRR
jgi:hypothetical protein